MNKADAFESFKMAVKAVAAEMGCENPSIFRDDADSWSAMFECVGRELPQHIEEAGFTPKLRFEVTVSQTYGHDELHVMVDRGTEARTGSARLTDLVTSGSDALEPICTAIGVSLYV